MHRREFIIGITAALSAIAVGCSPDTTDYNLRQADVALPTVQPLALRGSNDYSPWALNTAELSPVRESIGSDERLARLAILTGVRSDRNVGLLPWRASLQLPPSIDQGGIVSSTLQIQRLSVGLFASAFPWMETEIPEGKDNIAINLDVRLPRGDAYGWVVREGTQLIVAQLQAEGSSDVHNRRIFAFSLPPLPALG